MPDPIPDPEHQSPATESPTPMGRSTTGVCRCPHCTCRAATGLGVCPACREGRHAEEVRARTR